jgi:polyisoprenoid-binding protein YceI
MAKMLAAPVPGHWQCGAQEAVPRRRRQRRLARLLGLGLAAFALIMLAGEAALAQAFTFDKERTTAIFTYEVAVVQRSGEFRAVSGRVELDENAPSRNRVDLVIQTSSLVASAISAGQLKGADFFDIARHPELRFVSKSVRETGPGRTEMTGDLTMKGVTRSIRLDVVVKPLAAGPGETPESAAASRSFTASTRLSRSAFNMTAMGFLVPDEVGITVRGVLRPMP